MINIQQTIQAKEKRLKQEAQNTYNQITDVYNKKKQTLKKELKKQIAEKQENNYQIFAVEFSKYCEDELEGLNLIKEFKINQIEELEQKLRESIQQIEKQEQKLTQKSMQLDKLYEVAFSQLKQKKQLELEAERLKIQQQIQKQVQQYKKTLEIQ